MSFFSSIAYLADSANVLWKIPFRLYKLLSKENEKLLPTKCLPHLVYNSAKKECNLLASDIQAFIVKVLSHF